MVIKNIWYDSNLFIQNELKYCNLTLIRLYICM